MYTQTSKCFCSFYLQGTLSRPHPGLLIDWISLYSAYPTRLSICHYTPPHTTATFVCSNEGFDGTATQQPERWEQSKDSPADSLHSLLKAAILLLAMIPSASFSQTVFFCSTRHTLGLQKKSNIYLKNQHSVDAFILFWVVIWLLEGLSNTRTS